MFFYLKILTQLLDVEVMHGDFLSLNPNDPSFSKVNMILISDNNGCLGSQWFYNMWINILTTIFLSAVENTPWITCFICFLQQNYHHALI